MIFQGILTSIAKIPYIFVIFQGGPDPLSPPLDPPMAKTFDYEQVLVDLLFCYAANCKDHYQKLYILFYGTQIETNPVLQSVKIKMSTKGVKSIKKI